MRCTLWTLIIALFTIQCRNAEDYFRKAEDLHEEGRLSAAIPVYDLAIRKNPFFKDAYIQKGLCFAALNLTDSAIRVFNQLQDFFPENTASHYYAGLCHYRQKKYPEAIDCFNRALECKGGFDVEGSDSIRLLLDLNKDRFQSELPEIDIPSYEILYNRGMAYFKTGEVRKASLDFSNCVLQEYYPGTSYYMIGLCRLALKQKKKARESFLMATRYGENFSVQRPDILSSIP
jgi:tetratricopeptide (TPR) repeat protein